MLLKVKWIWGCPRTQEQQKRALICVCSCPGLWQESGMECCPSPGRQQGSWSAQVPRAQPSCATSQHRSLCLQLQAGEGRRIANHHTFQSPNCIFVPTGLQSQFISDWVEFDWNGSQSVPGKTCVFLRYANNNHRTPEWVRMNLIVHPVPNLLPTAGTPPLDLLA